VSEGASEPNELIATAIRQAEYHSTITFAELVAGCTADERDQLAWHLAMIRARKTCEDLKNARR
jgi:hypothetical protein